MDANNDRFATLESDLTYFIHTVDGQRYGAWYRVTSPEHLEVIGVGMLETTEFAGFSPESTARSVLENFVREQRSLGIAMPCLDSSEAVSEDSGDDFGNALAVREPHQSLPR